MALTRTHVERAASDYREREPLDAVEREQVETLPAAFADGRFGWRDAVWVVRWYYRRHLGAYPDAERRAAEQRFEEADFETVRRVLIDVASPDSPPDSTADRLARLTDLDGVDVPVASAFLAFTAPDEAVVVGPRVWETLYREGELPRPYPDPPSADDYDAFLDACLTVTERVDCRPWTLYRALWRLAADSRELEES